MSADGRRISETLARIRAIAALEDEDGARRAAAELAADLRGEGGARPVEARGSMGSATAASRAGEPDGMLAGRASQELTRPEVGEAAPLASEVALRRLIEAMPFAVWVMDADGAVSMVSDALSELVGAPLGHALGFDWEGIVHPDEVEGAVAAWTRAVKEGLPLDLELRFRRQHGVYRTHTVRVRPLRGATGEVERWLGSALDVEDRRRLEEEARQLASRLTATLESVTEAFFIIDSEQRFTFVNNAMEVMTERSREELLGRRLTDAFPPQEGSTFHLEYERAIRDHCAVRFEEHYPSLGKWFAVHAYPSEEGLAVFFRDVTALREAYDELRRSEARLRAVVRATTDVIWEWDMATDAVWWGDGLEETFGLRADALGGDIEGWCRHVHPDDRERVRASLRAMVSEGGADWIDEYRFRRGDGEYVWVIDRGFVIRGEGGRGVRMFGGLADETERLSAMERLREQAELLDRAPDAILVRDLEHTIVYANRGAERVYGWTREELLGRSIRDLLYADPQPFDEANAAVIADGEWSGALDQRQKGGRVITVEGRWSLVRDAAGAPSRVLVINTDVTDRRRLLARFMRAQRLESVGTLAGGIAHDLNNALAPILLSMNALRAEITAEHLHETLDLIEASAQRGAELVRRVLAFARGVEGAQVPVALDRVAEDLFRVLRDTFPVNIRVHLVVAPKVWLVQGDPALLHQLLMQLAVNARDAMPRGGELQIAIDNVTLDAHYAALSPKATPGPHVRLTVSDTGEGMTAAVRERIFDPFFTTRDVGQGTGLGLSTVDAILRSHGGFVSVYSEPGGGSTFRVYLPATLPLSPVTRPRARAGRGDPPRGKGELILLADDDPTVRDVTGQTLEAFGYRVEAVADGADAVAAYSKAGGEVALVLLDVMMPVMDGPTTIKVLKRIDPDVKVVAASGAGGDERVGRAVDAGALCFLPKPYTARTLFEVIHRILHGEGARQ